MRHAMTLLFVLGVVSLEAAAHAQDERDASPQVRPAGHPSHLVVSREHPTFGDRYVDALAGTWAAAGVGLAGAGLVGLGVGAAIGCSSSDPGFGCLAFTMLGGSVGAAAGWLIGAGIGATLGAGLSPEEGFGALMLGLLATAAPLAVSIAAGAAANDWVAGFTVGGISGGLTLAFFVPLVATLLADAGGSSASVFLAPSRHGLQLGATGQF